MAARSFKAGDTIMKSEPFVHVLLHSECDKRCSHCLVSAEKLLKCSACKLVKYCNIKCQRNSWLFHRVECEGLRKLAPKVPKDSVRLFLRILLRLQAGDDRREYEEVFGVKRQYSDLMSHSVEMKKDNARCGDFMELYTALKIFAENFPLPPTEELFEHFGKMAINSYGITDAECQIIGTGLYLGASILDHSCRPNAVVVYNGISLEVRCIEAICPTDKPTICYIPRWDTIALRRHTLENDYYFTCWCESCQDVELDNQMQSVHCETPNCKGAVVYDMNSDFLPCPECGRTEYSHEYEEKLVDALNKSQSVLVQAQKLKREKRAGENFNACEKWLNESSGLIHPLNVNSVKILDTSFDACIDLGYWEKAADYGDRLITEGHRHYSSQVSPIFGVHLMKLGKILLYLDRIESAKFFLDWAYKIVSITHGHSHALYETLGQLLHQCELGSLEFDMLKALPETSLD